LPNAVALVPPPWAPFWHF